MQEVGGRQARRPGPRLLVQKGPQRKGGLLHRPQAVSTNLLFPGEQGG